MSGGEQRISDASCNSYASDNNMPFYATQDYDTTTDGQCFVSNNFSFARNAHHYHDHLI